jgi:hypothetical protein
MHHPVRLNRNTMLEGSGETQHRDETQHNEMSAMVCESVCHVLHA